MRSPSRLASWSVLVALLSADVAWGGPPGREPAPSQSSTTAGTAGLDELLDLLPPEPEEPSPPPWARGWVWALASSVVVAGVVGAVVAARTSPSCFCVRPRGAACSGCD